MPNPIAICIEDLDTSSEANRYLRCVAVVGRGHGLAVDARGAVTWKRSDEDAAFELCTSQDEQLALFKPGESGSVQVSRQGRTLDVPCGKPVILLDGDEIAVAGRNLRVHVHGPAPAVHPPSLLPAPTGRFRKVARAAAAALAIGASAGAVGCKDEAAAQPTLEVRQKPPVVAPPRRPDVSKPAPDVPAPKPDSGPSPTPPKDASKSK